MRHRSISSGKIWSGLVMAAIGGGLLLSGCEKMENEGRLADKRVDLKIADSQANAQGFGDAPKKALDDAKAAAAISGASDAGKARANSALARAEYDEALALWPQLQDNSIKLQQALWDVRSEAMEMQRIELTASYYTQLDPKDAIAKVDEVHGQIQTQLDKSKTDLDSLKADLEKRKQEIADLTSQRQKLQMQAADLASKSEAAKGKQSVDLFKQSADASIKAGDLAAQIDTKNAQLMPVEHQIDMAARQQQLLDGNNGALPTLDAQKNQLAAGWDSSKQHSDEIKGGVKKILDESITPNTDKSNPNSGAKLQALLAENDSLAARIEKLLSDAVGHADTAAKAATTLHRDLSQQLNALKPTSPDRGPLQQMIAAYDEQQYQLLKGNVQLALANFYAGRSVLAAERKQTVDQLTAALQAAGLQAPAELKSVDADAVRTSADKTFAAAEDTLQKVSSANANTEGLRPIKNGALGSLIYARWGHLQLTADATEKNALQQDLDRAKENQIEIPANVTVQ